MVKRRSPTHHEDDAQRNLITWASHVVLEQAPDVEPRGRLIDYLYAIPNGGKRGKIEAARLKGLGVKAGVYDMQLALGRGGYFGLYVEMKRDRHLFRTPGEADRAVSDNQKKWGKRASRANYKTVVCYGFDQARKAIREYLAGAPTIEMINAAMED